MSTKKSPGKPAPVPDPERSVGETPGPSEESSAARPRPRAEKVDGEAAVLEKISALPAPFRAIGERLHELIKANAPLLTPKLWYGLPAYARDGKVVCFFRGPQVFKERYLTLGFNDAANLDEGTFWPIAFALTELTADDEARIVELVKKAVG